MENTNACFCCGLCCTRFRIIVTSEEAARIAASSGVPIETFADEYGAYDWFGPDALMLRQRDGGCFFLKHKDEKENLCGIHEVKPAVCQEWTAGFSRRVCQDGLARYWQLEVSPSGELKGDEKQIRKFRDFLKSLSG